MYKNAKIVLNQILHEDMNKTKEIFTTVLINRLLKLHYPATGFNHAEDTVYVDKEKNLGVMISVVPTYNRELRVKIVLSEETSVTTAALLVDTLSVIFSTIPEVNTATWSTE